MEPAAKPANEAQRLQALRQFHVLDTEAEQAFDDLTNLAAFICDAPIAVVTLIDDERQWFKSKIGIDGTETTRDLSFCAHAILQPELSGALKARKLGHIQAVQPDVIVSGNIGCLQQLNGSIPAVHLAELLDWAEGGPSQLPASGRAVEMPVAAR